MVFGFWGFIYKATPAAADEASEALLAEGQSAQGDAAAAAAPAASAPTVAAAAAAATTVAAPPASLPISAPAPTSTDLDLFGGQSASGI